MNDRTIRIIEKSAKKPLTGLCLAKLCLDGCANYGNVLQSYALQQTLEKMGAEVDCLWHMVGALDHPLQAWPAWWHSPKGMIKFILNWRGERDKLLSGFYGWEMTRMQAIYQFCQRFLHIRRTGMDLEPLSNEYDDFVVGSDQVWNPLVNPIFKEHMLLTFAPPHKRVSYAASISHPEITESMREFYKKAWTEMPYISVREEDGANLVRELTGREAEVHLDPTLLLTAEEWATIEQRPTWYHGEGGDYMLTYFLGNRPAAVEKTAKVTGLKVIHLLDTKNFDHYVTSPEEFIYLIHHAALVYTDSFHGTVFSIHFRRPFVVCDRVQQGADKMTSRIDTLLGMFGIKGRRGTAENNYSIGSPLEMEYPVGIDSVLKKERVRSRSYLMEALKKK